MDENNTPLVRKVDPLSGHRNAIVDENVRSENFPNARKCGAVRKRHPELGPCGAPAMENGRCFHHGGQSPGGKMTANGKYSKHLPPDLLSRFQKLRENPELLSLQEEIALHQTRLCQLLERIDTAETSRAWKRAWELFCELMSLRDNPEQAALVMNELGNILKYGFGQTGAWDEITAQTGHLRVLQGTEHRRLESIQWFITAQQAEVLFAQVIESITKHVEDPHIRAAIARDLVGLATNAGSGSVGPTPALGTGSE